MGCGGRRRLDSRLGSRGEGRIPSAWGRRRRATTAGPDGGPHGWGWMTEPRAGVPIGSGSRPWPERDQRWRRGRIRPRGSGVLPGHRHHLGDPSHSAPRYPQQGSHGRSPLARGRTARSSGSRRVRPLTARVKKTRSSRQTCWRVQGPIRVSIFPESLFRQRGEPFGPLDCGPAFQAALEKPVARGSRPKHRPGSLRSHRRRCGVFKGLPRSLMGYPLQAGSKGSARGANLITSRVSSS